MPDDTIDTYLPRRECWPFVGRGIVPLTIGLAIKFVLSAGRTIVAPRLGTDRTPHRTFRAGAVLRSR